jgi:hypothetical protein
MRECALLLENKTMLGFYLKKRTEMTRRQSRLCANATRIPHTSIDSLSRSQHLPLLSRSPLQPTYLTQTRQMHRLVITTAPPSWRITPQLQIQIIVRAIALADQHVQLPPIAAALHSDDGIALEPPRRRVSRLRKHEGLVRGGSVDDVEVLRGFFGLNGAADGEVVGGGLGAEDGNGRWKEERVRVCTSCSEDFSRFDMGSELRWMGWGIPFLGLAWR